jgi:hypothetical protein
MWGLLDGGARVDRSVVAVPPVRHGSSFAGRVVVPAVQPGASAPLHVVYGSRQSASPAGAASSRAHPAPHPSASQSGVDVAAARVSARLPLRSSVTVSSALDPRSQGPAVDDSRHGGVSHAPPRPAVAPRSADVPRGDILHLSLEEFVSESFRSPAGSTVSSAARVAADVGVPAHTPAFVQGPSAVSRHVPVVARAPHAAVPPRDLFAVLPASGSPLALDVPAASLHSSVASQAVLRPIVESPLLATPTSSSAWSRGAVVSALDPPRHGSDGSGLFASSGMPHCTPVCAPVHGRVSLWDPVFGVRGRHGTPDSRPASSDPFGLPPLHNVAAPPSGGVLDSAELLAIELRRGIQRSVSFFQPPVGAEMVWPYAARIARFWDAFELTLNACALRERLAVADAAVEFVAVQALVDKLEPLYFRRCVASVLDSSFTLVVLKRLLSSPAAARCFDASLAATREAVRLAARQERVMAGDQFMLSFPYAKELFEASNQFYEEAQLLVASPSSAAPGACASVVAVPRGLGSSYQQPSFDAVVCDDSDDGGDDTAHHYGDDDDDDDVDDDDDDDDDVDGDHDDDAHDDYDGDQDGDGDGADGPHRSDDAGDDDADEYHGNGGNAADADFDRQYRGGSGGRDGGDDECYEDRGSSGAAEHEGDGDPRGVGDPLVDSVSGGDGCEGGSRGRCTPCADCGCSSDRCDPSFCSLAQTEQHACLMSVAAAVGDVVGGTPVGAVVDVGLSSSSVLLPVAAVDAPALVQSSVAGQLSLGVGSLCLHLNVAFDSSAQRSVVGSSAAERILSWWAVRACQFPGVSVRLMPPSGPAVPSASAPEFALVGSQLVVAGASWIPSSSSLGDVFPLSVLELLVVPSLSDVVVLARCDSVSRVGVDLVRQCELQHAAHVCVVDAPAAVAVTSGAPLVASVPGSLDGSSDACCSVSVGGIVLPVPLALSGSVSAGASVPSSLGPASPAVASVVDACVSVEPEMLLDQSVQGAVSSTTVSVFPREGASMSLAVARSLMTSRHEELEALLSSSGAFAAPVSVGDVDGVVEYSSELQLVTLLSAYPSVDVVASPRPVPVDRPPPLSFPALRYAGACARFMHVDHGCYVRRGVG